MKLLIITQKVDQNDQLLGFFIEWLKKFAEKFEKITVICLWRGECLLPENVEVFSIGKEKGYSKIRQLFTFYFLLFTLRKRYGAVFIHMNPIWMVLGGIVWKLLNKKACLWYTHKQVTTKLKLAEKFVDVIFTASKESFRLLSNKVIVTGHGIDTELFKPNYQLPITNYQLKILSVGRISPVKNYETLVDAVKILKDKGENIMVTIIGEAPLEKDKDYEKKLKLLITNYQLQSYFNFVGKIGHNDLPQQYQSHDVFIHLSKTGSLDKVLLEAMASEVRVLSSNDWSRNNLPPELTFNGDDPRELVAKLEKIFEADHRKRLRDYVVENHDLKRLINKIYSAISS